MEPRCRFPSTHHLLIKPIEAARGPIVTEGSRPHRDDNAATVAEETIVPQGLVTAIPTASADREASRSAWDRLILVRIRCRGFSPIVWNPRRWRASSRLGPGPVKRDLAPRAPSHRAGSFQHPSKFSAFLGVVESHRTVANFIDSDEREDTYSARGIIRRRANDGSRRAVDELRGWIASVGSVLCSIVGDLPRTRTRSLRRARAR